MYNIARMTWLEGYSNYIVVGSQGKDLHRALGEKVIIGQHWKWVPG